MNSQINNFALRDVFLSHAHKDKEKYIFPIVRLLEHREISYWLDEAELKWGKSLLESLSEGIIKSKYVIVFISDNFLEGNWTKFELENAFTSEITSGQIKVLPVFLTNSKKILDKFSFLNFKIWINWEDGIENIVEQIEIALGRNYKSEWEFTHPAEYKGNVWLKILPKFENINKIHIYTIKWGAWYKESKIDNISPGGIILDFKKINERNTWPIKFTISPPAFVTAGKGKILIDINNNWKLINKKDRWVNTWAKITQYFILKSKP